MNKLFKFTNVVIVFIFLINTFTVAYSQTNNTNVTESGKPEKKPARDDIYDRYMTKERQILGYKNLHEKDVLWEKRVTRVIDVREKRNHFFAYRKDDNKKTFISILFEAAKKGQITAYKTTENYDNDFSQPYDQSEMLNLGRSLDTIIKFDPETLKDTTIIIVNEVKEMDVMQYRIKEVYYFDEEQSDLSVRILGIAPIYNKYNTQTGDFIAQIPLFWVYYPDIRQVLANVPAYNESNDRDGFSWDDVFQLRLFSSYITKESNVNDRRIQDYKSGISILYESDNIKNSIFHFEHDVWDY